MKEGSNAHSLGNGRLSGELDNQMEGLGVRDLLDEERKQSAKDWGLDGTKQEDQKNGRTAVTLGVYSNRAESRG